ncbi:hypothetical protein MBANPS3_008568 [Mucor bainieri]
MQHRVRLASKSPFLLSLHTMSRISALPQELLLIVFNHVDSAAQMAECRLVCQRWNTLAQPLVLTKKLLITNEKKANQLHNYLLEHPHYATLIRTMDVNTRYVKENGFMKLMSLAFTPRMESLTGHVRSKEFFYKLVAIAKSFGADTFSNLKSIPHSLGDDSIHHARRSALHLFKETLESVHLVLLDQVNQLPTFKNLKKLSLDMLSSDETRMSAILEKCPQVEELSIHSVVPESIDINMTDRDASWNKRIVMRAKEICALVECIHGLSLYSLKFRLTSGSTVKYIKDCILHHGGKVVVCNSYKQRGKYQIFCPPRTVYANERIHYIEVSSNDNN